MGRKNFLFMAIALFISAIANAESVRLSNDTLYCNLSTQEINITDYQIVRC